MVSLTKDSSHDMHVDAEPVGFLGPLVWWPAFARSLAEARAHALDGYSKL